MTPLPPDTASDRRIIHIDMDAFYASVEQRDAPDLRGIPLAVGGSRERGVVAAASYEARRFGVRSAMPSVVARRKCPQLVFVRPRFDVYRAVSQQIHAIFARYTPLIQPLSLDEAYLDVTHAIATHGSATQIARSIRAEIFDETGLTASAGVSYNKFLAKLASDHRKPNGLFIITPSMGLAFVETLEVGAFHGIGPATVRRMHALGLKTGLDLRRQSLEFLIHHFGKAGQFYHNIARARDDRPVDATRVRKSLGAETTFEHDLHDIPAVHKALNDLSMKVWSLMDSKGLQGRTVTLKVKYNNFQQVTRSRTYESIIGSGEALFSIVTELFSSLCPLSMRVRLLGVIISSFSSDFSEETKHDQLTLSL